MSNNNSNNTTNNNISNDELDSMFDITPSSIKDRLDTMLSNSRDSGLAMEMEAACDEVTHSSPRDAWNAIKRPFSKKNNNKTNS